MYPWYICICGLSAGVYLNTLKAGFVYDDNRAIISNQDIRTNSPIMGLFRNDFWGTPISSSNSHGSYRPLCVFTFRLNYWAGGLHPFGYHLVNILLHSIATGLVLHTGRLVLPGKCAITAAVIFAVHPVHTEAVAGVVGRADLLACIFFLLSFIMYVRYVEFRRLFGNNFAQEVKQPFRSKTNLTKSIYCANIFTNISKNNCLINLNKSNARYIYKYLFLFLCFGFSICATLCKETGITVLGVCAVYEMLGRKTKHRGTISSKFSLIAISVVAFLIFTLRISLAGMKNPTFSSADNPTAHEPLLLTRSLTFLYLPLINFCLLLFPKQLSFDWSMEAIQRIRTLIDARNMLTFIFYFILYRTVKISYYKVIVKRKEKTISIKQKNKCYVCHENQNNFHSSICRLGNNNNTPTVCLCFATTQRGFNRHESLLMCLAFMVLPFLPATNLPFYVGFVVAERVLYLPSVGFCYLFALGLNISQSRMKKNITFLFFSYLLLTYAARTWQRNEDWKDEESLYRAAISVNPPKAYGNLGSVFSSLGRYKEAEEAFRLALLYRSNMADVHYNLGNLHIKLERYEEAIRNYEMAIRLRPSLAVSYLNLGHALASLGRHEEAQQVFVKCTQLESSGLKDVKAHKSAQASAFMALTRLNIESGRLVEAAEFYREGVGMRRNSDVETKTFNDATEIVTEKRANGNVKNKFNDLLDPYTSQDFFNFTKVKKKNMTYGQEEISHGLQLPFKSKEPNLYMQYGKYLIDKSRYKEAVATYWKASELGVDQYNVATSAAAALREAGRHEDAERFYRKAVSIRPKDSTSLVNLGAILHLQGNRLEQKAKYKRAEHYYTEARRNYEKALKLNPSDETAVVNLMKLNSVKKIRL